MIPAPMARSSSRTLIALRFWLIVSVKRSACSAPPAKRSRLLRRASAPSHEARPSTGRRSRSQSSAGSAKRMSGDPPEARRREEPLEEEQARRGEQEHREALGVEDPHAALDL